MTNEMLDFLRNSDKLKEFYEEIKSTESITETDYTPLEVLEITTKLVTSGKANIFNLATTVDKLVRSKRVSRTPKEPVAFEDLSDDALKQLGFLACGKILKEHLAQFAEAGAIPLSEGNILSMVSTLGKITKEMLSSFDEALDLRKYYELMDFEYRYKSEIMDFNHFYTKNEDDIKILYGVLSVPVSDINAEERKFLYDTITNLHNVFTINRMQNIQL